MPRGFFGEGVEEGFNAIWQEVKENNPLAIVAAERGAILTKCKQSETNVHVLNENSIKRQGFSVLFIGAAVQSESYAATLWHGSIGIDIDIEQLQGCTLH